MLVLIYAILVCPMVGLWLKASYDINVLEIAEQVANRLGEIFAKIIPYSGIRGALVAGLLIIGLVAVGG